MRDLGDVSELKEYVVHTLHCVYIRRGIFRPVTIANWLYISFGCGDVVPLQVVQSWFMLV